MIQNPILRNENDILLGRNTRRKTRTTRRTGIADEKGPMKACYNPDEDKWALKYSYRSPQTVQSQAKATSSKVRKPVSNTRIATQDSHIDTSDYGTMSRADEESVQRDAFTNMHELIPRLNHGGENMSTFSDISVEERRERIDNILSDILAVPRLVDANLSRRSLSRSSTVRRYLSSDRLSEAGSVAGSSRGLRRSISSPKLDFIPETKPCPTARNKMPSVKHSLKTVQTKSQKSQKQVVPSLNLRQFSQPVVSRLSREMSAEHQELSAEHLPHRDESMTRLVPNIGQDTRDELAIAAPTLGDDTTQLDLGLDTSRHSHSQGPGPPDFVRQNIISAAAFQPKGTESGRSSTATVHMSKHKAGSVPKYLRTRQAAWRDAEVAALAAVPDPDCPPHHRMLSGEEREQGLVARQQQHSQLLQEANRLPVSSDTRRVRLRRMELETELARVEEEIRVYSRNKVFVKVNEDGENLE